MNIVKLSIVAELLAAFAFGSVGQAADNYIWWEGEAFTETNSSKPLENVPGNTRPDQQAKLSGGKWMTPREPQEGGPCTIRYEVDVPADKAYNFWVRKFWKHGPFKWRFDDQPWRECGKNITLKDSVFLEKHWGANWVSLGEVKLAKGKHTFQVEMIENAGCFDCWLLIDGPFAPRGKLKPGQKSGLADPGFFAWEPSADPLADDCPIDMKHLNQPITGFAKREGKGYVDAEGRSLRFWMVQGSGLMNMSHKDIGTWARRLAKYGVNLNRVQLSAFFASYMNGNDDAFAKALDNLHYLVAALKKQGIYTFLGHLYWQTHATVGEKMAGPGYGTGKKPLELLFLDPNFQKVYREYVGAIMNRPNPYTGLPLSKEPAVAFVEIQNESSMFFWTFKPAAMVPQTLQLMEKAFGDWATKKYGSIDKALRTWGDEKGPERLSKATRTVPGEGRVALYGIGHLTGADWAAAQRNPQRASDQLQFMVEWQNAFYEDMVTSLRGKVGLRNMIACSNWKTADPKVLGIFERASYKAGDVICRNVYFDVAYKSRPERFYAIDPGDTFRVQSALKPPARPAPLTVGHVDDFPYMITENNWCRPNRYRAEWPFLIATYAQMMGVDGWNFFALGSAQWSSNMPVWGVNSPSILGQFPAASLIFRKGYVKEAGFAVQETLNRKGLYSFKGSRFYELGGQDALWVSKIGDKESGADAKATQAEPLAYFVGKVNRTISDESGRLETVDFSKYVDRDGKKVRSMTGELEWDYGTGLVTVNAPCAQGAAGFVGGAGQIKLRDITIDCRNEYASILAVPLDDKPLAESNRILIQIATEDRPYGYKTQKKGGYERITDLGNAPTNMKKIDADITLTGRTGKVTILDENGYRTSRKARTAPAGKGMKVTFPQDAMYVIVE